MYRIVILFANIMNFQLSPRSRSVDSDLAILNIIMHIEHFTKEFIERLLSS
jgi:hypothetical protein